MRLLGHPLHAALVAFPIGLLGIAPLWDLSARFHLLAGAQVAGYFCQLGGLGGGALAVLTGFADFMKIADPRSRPARAALTHAGVALSTICLAGLAFALRGGRTAQPGVVALALELLAAGALAATGWLGGHLVFHHRVGVEEAGGPGPTARDDGQ